MIPFEKGPFISHRTLGCLPHTALITEAHWRQLPAALRTPLRRRLGGKQAIVGRQVLDLARALCDRGAYGLAFDLYRALKGHPLKARHNYLSASGE